MILSIFTLTHVLISLIGIVAGLFVLAGLLRGQPCESWTEWFLTTTVLTSVTGFLFPVHHFLPSHAVGIVSLGLLAIAIFARYRRYLAGNGRWAYVVCAVLALYLNVFVGVVQSFQKISGLKALAPTQTEAPFKITQLVVLVIFIALGTLATVRFRPAPPAVDTAG